MEESSKVAIVTGASRGIGRAIALRLTREGFAVVVNYANNQVEADKVVGEIEDTGGRAVAIRADVSKTEDVVRLFDQAERAFDGADVLVNSAGIMKVEPVADFETRPSIASSLLTCGARSTRSSRRSSGCGPGAVLSISQPA